jgi:hypothetical protein
VCEGGNILRGNNNGFDYILKTWINTKYRTSTCTESDITDMTGVGAFNILNVAKTYDVPTKTRVVFHADMYCTIVGDIGNGRELILLADPYKETHWEFINKAIRGLKRRLTKLGDCEGAPKFVIGTLPLIVINDENCKLTHVFSYNNCLVENYVDENKVRIINFYFPNFQEEISNYSGNSAKTKFTLLKAFTKQEEKLELAEAAHAKHGLANSVMAMPVHQLGTVNPEIDNAQKEIISTLARIFEGIPNLKHNVQFVRHNFRSLSQKRGGLHCIAKVIERDMI